MVRQDTEFSLAVQRIENARYGGCYYVTTRDAYYLLEYYRKRLKEIKDLKQYRNYLEQELHAQLRKRKLLSVKDLLGKQMQVTVHNRYTCRRRLQPLVRRLLKTV